MLIAPPRLRRLLAVSPLLVLAGLLGCGQPDADGDAVPADRDCDETDPYTYPGAPELCDNKDNNCNGEIDEQPADGPLWYFDRDGDGFGDDRIWVRECQPIAAGYVQQAGDCDDADGDAFPGGAEVCDGVDNDCDGAVDEGSEQSEAWYADTDGDGFGDPEGLLYACFEPDGYVEDSSDCDDSDALKFPGADEYCNGADDDCDGTIDEPGVVDGTPTFEDKDSDRLGDPTTEQVVCTPPTGAVLNGDDCDDRDSDVRSGCTCSDYSDGDLIIATDETITLEGGEHFFQRVEIEPGGVLQFRSGPPASIYAFQIRVDGVIDLRGQDGVNSASGSPPDGGNAGPGGGGGGGGGTCGNGNGDGGAPNGGEPPSGARTAGGDGGPPVDVDVPFATGGALSGSTGYGGGGGGHEGDGRDGGGSSGVDGQGGQRFGTSELTSDFAGGGGGAGGAANGGGGGGGGGALKLFASYITITGEIKADGGFGGGRNNGGCSPGGGGGGGGGAIWIHGDQVVVDDAAFSALGGRGGTSGVSFGGGSGADGRIRISGLDVDLKARRISPGPFTDATAPPCPLPEPEVPEE